MTETREDIPRDDRDLIDGDLREPDLGDPDLRDPDWWSPAWILSAESAALSAFTLAVLGMFGGASLAAVVAQSLGGVRSEPADVRWDVLVPASMALLFALSAVLLARRVIVATRTDPTWATHLAGAAAVVAGASAAASVVAMAACALGAPPGV